MGPSSTLPSGHQSYMPPYVGCVCPFTVAGLTTVGMLVSGTGPQPSWLQSPASCSGCGAAGGWGRLPVWLAEQPGEGRQPLPAHWRAGLDPSEAVCMAWGGTLGRGCCQLTGGWISPQHEYARGRIPNGTCRCWCHCGRRSSQKWLLPVSSSLGGPAASCLFERLSKISRWV